MDNLESAGAADQAELVVNLNEVIMEEHSEEEEKSEEGMDKYFSASSGSSIPRILILDVLVYSRIRISSVGVQRMTSV